MKNFIIPLLFLLITTVSCAQKRLVTSTAAVQVIDSYINMKNSLIVSDQLKTAKGADTLLKAIASFKNRSSKHMAKAKLQMEMDSISKYAGQIAVADNINKQRKLFSSLSTAVWKLAEKVSHPGEALYLQVCPMTQVSWLSKETLIRNPYYPKNMLDCGAVKGQN